MNQTLESNLEESLNNLSTQIRVRKMSLSHNYLSFKRLLITPNHLQMTLIYMSSLNINSTPSNYSKILILLRNRSNHME